jgi:hypothetical protein
MTKSGLACTNTAVQCVCVTLITFWCPHAATIIFVASALDKWARKPKSMISMSLGASTVWLMISNWRMFSLRIPSRSILIRPPSLGRSISANGRMFCSPRHRNYRGHNLASRCQLLKSHHRKLACRWQTGNLSRRPMRGRLKIRIMGFKWWFIQPKSKLIMNSSRRG